MTGATARALQAARPRPSQGRLSRRRHNLRPCRLHDRATYTDPHQYPTGPRTTVLVNGVLVVENATHTGATPGMVMRRAADGKVG